MRDHFFSATRSLSFVFLPLIFLSLFCLEPGAAAAERNSKTESTAASSREPTALEDDANLHDIQFAGSRQGWAVGDRGVIWHTSDGGQSWSLQTSSVSCALHSISFLSDRVGWIAGGGTAPFTRHSYGVILKTIDGGQTWQPLVAPPIALISGAGQQKAAETAKAKGDSPPAVTLPRLRRVRFFSADEGVVVGEGTGAKPGGAFATEDGGQSWHSLPGKVSPGWLAADFLTPQTGILVGAQGSRALVADGKIVASRFESLGVRGLHDVVLGSNRTGWMAGDGGLVLRTANAGLVWQPPPAALPEGTRETFDFRAVCVRGNKIWIAGDPGSVVWHSPDAGFSWQKQLTQNPVPIARLYFSSENRGWAVGALGTFLQTDNGGKSWRAVRGGKRRVALMALFGDTSQASLALIAEQSGDAGYRSLVAVVARPGDASAALSEPEQNARLADAVTSAGGSAFLTGWRLPLVIPGLERDAARLIADWNRRTENRLDEFLIGALVRQIRTWRPSVLVIPQPDTGNALARLIGEAALKAVEQAPDATRFIEHHELAGLEPWEVEKVYVRLPPGSSGHVNVDPFRYLPWLRATTNLVTETAEGLFRNEAEIKLSRESYRLIRSQWQEGQAATFAGGVFNGLSIPPGSPARRALGTFDDSDLDTRQKIARQQRNFASYSEQCLDDSRRAGQLIAQLPEIVRGMSGAEAAWQMMHLAEQYQAVGQWELAELTLIELVERYPREPAALRAMQQLVQLWASAEVTWRRLRKSSTGLRRDQNHPEAIAQATVEQVEARLEQQSRNGKRSIFDEDEEFLPEAATAKPDDRPLPVAGASSDSRVFHKDLDRKFRFWQSRALKLARELARRDPALAGEPIVQFPLAAIHRQRTSFLKADEIYRRYVVHETGSPWSQAAGGEIWLNSPTGPRSGPASACRFAAKRPVLDGVLSDTCWLEAEELPLVASAGDSEAGAPRALAVLCYDTEYLYFAANLPRAKGLRTDGPLDRERRYDEDLADFDRVNLWLDLDRDYVTSFNFAVDQRGCTAESCWNDASWNPRWLVAVDADKTGWRVEVAIPLNELTPAVPQRGTAWALGIARVIPAVGIESWTLPASAAPHPENFGLLRFDAPGDPR